MKKHFATAILFILLIATSNNSFGQAAPASGKILAEAYKKAAKEKKNVIVIFHASWCGWCKKMDAAIHDETCSNFFDANYVITHLTVDESKENKQLENVGADLVRKKYNGDKAGLPFWLILDKEGKLLGDSFIRKEGEPLSTPGENMGCPAAEDEVAAFCQLLKKTSKMTDEQLEVIANRFKKNK